jgi:pimeloyl-ACP methyl ester carboxylesterase
MQFSSDTQSSGVRERVGSLVGNHGDVPFALWTPAAGDSVDRVILIGHGGSGDKHEGYVVALARGLVRRAACAVVAIDGPTHGARRVHATTPPILDFAAMWSSDTTMTDRLCDDWRVTLDATLALPEVRADALVGYWGLSMGTILGLPFVASESRVRACVLGLMGATGPTKERIVHDAVRINVPTMFLLQWDDSLFHRDDALALYGLLGASDKVLLATPGEHAGVTAESFESSANFLLSRLEKAATGRE